ncbi:MAG TPA: enoyl-CoA hydratase-related protein [Anaerovoracaceae bacterium]|nr:enoyl-CoA hydratase-related protein [Anaerovoracaceae bacterium]
MDETIILNKERNTAIITINRPEALNALNGKVLEEFDKALDEVAGDPDVKALIITGAGRSFVAGADIAVQSVFDVEGGRAWGRRGSAIFRKLELMEIPTIAAVNGFALGGGCELALACDMIIASTKAKFGQPEVSLGITPGFSGTQRLPRRVGVSKAKELIFTGEMISGDEAERIGLANKVVEPEALMAAAMELTGKIVKNAPIAVKYSKACIDRGMDVGLESGISIENELFAMCYATSDQKEGMTAFLEKRPAEFKSE